MGMGGKKMIHLYDPIGPSSAHDIFHFFSKKMMMMTAIAIYECVWQRRVLLNLRPHVSRSHPFLRRLTFAIFGLLDLKLKLVNLIRFELISNSNSRLFNLKFLCKSTALRHDGMRVQRRHLFCVTKMISLFWLTLTFSGRGKRFERRGHEVLDPLGPGPLQGALWPAVGDRF